MSIPLHMEGRTRFFSAVQKVVGIGAAKWRQRWKRRGKDATFLKEVCDDACRKLYNDLQTAAKGDGTERWVRHKETAQGFLTRLRIADITQKRAGQKEYFGEEVLAWLDAEFDQFWITESIWINQDNENRNLLEVFKKLKGQQLLDEVIRGGDHNALYEEGVTATRALYYNNEYSKAVTRADALVVGVLNLEGERYRCFESLYAMSAIVSESNSMRILTKRSEPARHYVRYLRLTDRVADGELKRFIHGMSPAGVPWQLTFKSWRGLPYDAGELRIVAMIHTLKVLYKKNELEEEMEADSASRLMLLREMLNWRDQCYFAVGGKIELLSSRQDNDKEALYLSSANEFLACPEILIEKEWNWMMAARCSNADLNQSKCANLMARRWLSHVDGNASSACEWLIKSIKALEGCPNYLAWEGTYALIDEYWTWRRKSVLVDRVLQGRIDLLRAAFGANANVKEFEKRQRLLIDAPVPLKEQGLQQHEEPLRKLLMDTPPPLKHRKRN